MRDGVDGAGVLYAYYYCALVARELLVRADRATVLAFRLHRRRPSDATLRARHWRCNMHALAITLGRGRTSCLEPKITVRECGEDNSGNSGHHRSWIMHQRLRGRGPMIHSIHPLPPGPAVILLFKPVSDSVDLQSTRGLERRRWDLFRAA